MARLILQPILVILSRPTGSPSQLSLTFEDGSGLLFEVGRMVELPPPRRRKRKAKLKAKVAP